MDSEKTIYPQKGFPERVSLWFEKNCFITYAIAISAIIWPLMSLCYGDWLIRIESKSLFLYDTIFLQETILQPTGVLNYLSLFFTQFLHLPWLGSLLFCLLLILAAFLTRQVFDIDNKDTYLAFMPSVLIAILNVCTGYALYIIKTPGFFFSPVIGYTITIFAILCIKRVKSPVLSIPLIITWTILGYIAFGVYALASAVAIAIVEQRRESARSSKIAFAVFSFTFVFIAPLLTSFISTRYNGFVSALLAGFPVLTHEHSFKLYRIVAVLLIALPALLSFYYRSVKQLTKKGNPYILLTVLIIYCVSIYLCWFKDINFHAEQKMSNAIDNLNWEVVCKTHKEISEKRSNSDSKMYNKLTSLTDNATSAEETSEIIEKHKDKFYEPSRMMVLLKNLALVKTGKESDTAFSYKDGGRVQKFRSTIPLIMQCGKQLYLHYGLPNFAYRWCIEEAVEYGWNSETLKYAAKSCILTGDYKLATKFITRLEKTLFHKEWAKEMSQYVNNPSLIEDSAEMQNIKSLMCYDSELSNDKSLIETYLLNHFTKNRGTHATPYFDRVAMLWAMQTQDIPTFWICFNNYLTTNNPTEMPRHYQEAAILYGNLEKSVDVSKMPFDKSVITTYENFNKYVQQNRVSNMELARYPFYQRFGKTFYYFYYFVRNLNTY